MEISLLADKPEDIFFSLFSDEKKVNCNHAIAADMINTKTFIWNRKSTKCSPMC